MADGRPLLLLVASGVDVVLQLETRRGLLFNAETRVLGDMIVVVVVVVGAVIVVELLIEVGVGVGLRVE